MAESAEENSDEELDVDIAIVGAGPAGLYTAWRLLQDNNYKSQKIRVFDAAERIGGRVLSVQLPHIPFIAELGAMRFIPAQFLISKLVEHLDLSIDKKFNFSTDGYKLRSQYFSENLVTGEATTVNELPYRLNDDEKGKGPVTLIVFAILKAMRDIEFADVPNTDGDSINDLRDKLKKLDPNKPPRDPVNYFEPHEWRLIKFYGRVRGDFLYQTGFWDLVQQQLSEDAYNLANDGSGYQSILSMWNAADAILWYLADFACSDYHTIVGGMSQLIKRLGREVTQFGQRPGEGETQIIKVGCELQKISAVTNDGKKIFVLHFELDKYVTDAPPTRPFTVRAKKVILALPQPALKNLQLDGLKVKKQRKPNENPVDYFHELLDNVTANPLFKAFAFFMDYKDFRWPEQPEKDDNRCFRIYTDLQLRQIYHLGTERQCSTISTHHNRDNMCAVLLYSDARYADYWGNLDKMGDQTNRVFLKDFREGLDENDRKTFDRMLKTYGTSDLLQYRIRAFLERITGQKPQPITIIVKNWANPPTYAGWHSWNMGAQSWIISEQLVCPFEHAELFTCGEAFSSEQGWIEGALKSSERVLEKLGVPDPDWVVDKVAYRRAKALWVLKQ